MARPGPGRVSLSSRPLVQLQGVHDSTDQRLAQVRMASFWMRNTVIGLDIIFIGTDNRILNIAANAVPYSEESIPSAGPTKAVLELNAGRAAELGLAPGELVAW